MKTLLAIDTGGTFTDAVASLPDGSIRRLKVLSDGTLRLRIGETNGRRLELVGLDPAVQIDGLVGLELSGFETVVQAAGEVWIELDRELSIAPGLTVALSCSAGPVILAARLLLGADCRAAELRLATTRGTNALLTRQGPRVALVTNIGLEDLPWIRDQRRARLFSLEQPRPRPLAAAVVGVAARLAADGRELVAIDEGAIQELVATLAEHACDAVAIALLHADLEPKHERELAGALGGAGYRVVCSHELSPSIGLLARIETACCEAYLGAIIDGFLEASSAAVESPADQGLWVMRSSGELARRAEFRAVDSMLSGPAAGVLGAGAAASRHGLGAVVAFDMGGTSTDVARIDGGRPARRSRSTVGGIIIEREQLAIHTVAAGGGSIVSTRGGRLRIGPESAGANPGPACYGRGGPLSLTDLQLLAGWLDPDRASLPLDIRAAANAATALGLQRDEPQLLDALIRLADETMAEAVRVITLREGVDPASMTLVAFGGGGGVHAAAVAEELEISKVLIPDGSSVLSALGLSRATPGRNRRIQRLETLTSAVDGLRAELEGLAASLEIHGDEAAELALALRLVGQQHSIEIQIDMRMRLDLETIESAFSRAFLDRYGYRPPQRELELVAVIGRCSQAVTAIAAGAKALRVGPGAEGRWCRAVFGGAWVELLRFELDELEGGETIHGPALVDAPGTTIKVPTGWTLSISGGDALMSRQTISR